MSTPDLPQLLEQARGVQERMTEIQRALALRRVEGSPGGGMVTAAVTCAMRVLEIRIEPALLEGDDREMLQDLVAAAVNAALTEAQRVAQEEIQKAAGVAGMALPGMPTG